MSAGSNKNKEIINGENSVERNLFWRLFSNLPLSLSFSLAGFGSVLVALLLLEQFETKSILLFGTPVAILMFVVVSRLVNPESLGTLKERRIFDLLAVLFVIGWGIFNSSYNAQTVYLYRDPGLYNTTAKWMMDHDNIAIPSINPFGKNPNLYTTSNAGVNMLPEEPDRLYTHGLHLFPALVATVGRLSNEAGALKTNIAIGSLAILVVYAFIRLFAKPRWAFMAATVLSLSLPFLYFSRDSYTETISMLYFFSLLSAIYFSMKTNRKTLWVLSGFMAGATLMTRIDAYIGVAGLFIFLGMYLFFANKNNRGVRLINIGFFLLGSIATTVLGWLDLTQLATSYYRFHDDLIAKELLLIGGITVTGLALSLLNWRTNFGKRLIVFLDRLPIRTMAISISVLLVFALMMRPLYINTTQFYEIQTIGGSQSIVSQKVQTPESVVYDAGEPVIFWPVWYLGIILCLIAFFGFIVLTLRILRDKSLLLLPFYLSFTSVALLYFVVPSITPDHIWASRRILPLILPGIVFLAAYGVSRVSFRSFNNPLIYVIVSFLLIHGVLQTSGFFLKERVDNPTLTQINDFCNRIPENSAVLLIGILGLVGTQTVGSYCNTPTVRHVGTPTTAEFVEFYDSAVGSGYVPVVAAFDNDIGLYASNSRIIPLEKTEYETVEMVLGRHPEKMVSTYKKITYGILTPTGRAALSQN